MTTVLDRTRGTPDGCKPQANGLEQVPRRAPISVNGVLIPRADIGREMQHHPASKPIDAWYSAARALVVRELLLQEARRIGLRPDPLVDEEGRQESDEEALVRQLVEHEVIVPEPDEASCRRIYEHRATSFRSPTLYAVRHILIAADPADASLRDRARREAEALIDILREAPSEFSAVALKYSACPSKEQGGNLGQISRGQTVPEFEAALAAAPVGSVMGHPVETRYGLHVVCVDHRIDGDLIPFDVVRDEIASWLAMRSRETGIRQYIGMLAGCATISGIDLASQP